MNAQVFVQPDDERVVVTAKAKGREVTISLAAIAALTIADELTLCAEQIRRSR